MIADVGCGKGASTVLMAKAFPKSQFFGFDYHDKSIEGARATAAREGLEVRLNFGVGEEPKHFREKTTTWLPCSIVSTTWAIRLAPPRMCAKH